MSESKLLSLWSLDENRASLSNRVGRLFTFGLCGHAKQSVRDGVAAKIRPACYFHHFQLSATLDNLLGNGQRFATRGET